MGGASPNADGKGERRLKGGASRTQKPLDCREERWFLAAVAAFVFATALTAQEAPLRRTFTAGEERRYHVRLIVRSELEGPETVKIGAVTYVKTVQRFAEATLGWTAVERVVAGAVEGGATIREQEAAFEAVRVAQEPEEGDAQAARLAAALRETLTQWAATRTLEFHVAANGTAAGLERNTAPLLDELPPPLLTLWLAHALRPTAALPEHAPRPGELWQEPRDVTVAGWTDVHAGETGEWLEAPPTASNRAAMRLHVTQEISGKVNEPPPAQAGGEKAAAPSRNATVEKTERFFAESLTTLSLEDGSVLSASRSARKEIVQVLAAVAGMRETPRFRATLSVQVQIESCVEGRCEAAGNR